MIIMKHMDFKQTRITDIYFILYLENNVVLLSLSNGGNFIYIDICVHMGGIW